MPAEGIEPTHPCEYQILSLARLPVPPRRLFERVRSYGERLRDASPGLGGDGNWPARIRLPARGGPHGLPRSEHLLLLIANVLDFIFGAHL